LKQLKITVLLSAALAFGAAAGWFAAGLWGTKTGRTGEMPVAVNGQDAHSPSFNGQDVRCSRAIPAAKPKRKAPIRSSSHEKVQKRALEKRVRFLEDSLRIAKEKQTPKKADVTTASNEEIMERLLKLPTEGERDKELDRLGTNRLYTFTMGQLGKLYPKRYAAPSKDSKVWHARMVEKTAERLAILDSLDQSTMTEEERSLHRDFEEALVQLPEVYLEKLCLEDGSFAERTLGEVIENIQQLVSSQKRMDTLKAQERKMLISQMAKHFDVPDDAAADLLTVMDDVATFTDGTVFYRKK